MEKEFPRSPYERLLGYVHLPRLIDKARLHHQRRLVGYNYKTSGFDKTLLAFLGVDPDAFEAIAIQTSTDAAIIDWLQKNATQHSPEQIEAWNLQMISHHPDTAEKKAHYKFVLKEIGILPQRPITTYFDLIELEEGRFV